MKPFALRKLTLGISLLVLVSLLLGACQPAAAPANASPTQAPAASDIKVKVVFWSHDFKARETLDRKYIAKFISDNPNIDVEYVLGPGNDTEYVTKLMTAFAGNAAPDCFNIRASNAGPLLTGNLVIPVDPSVFGYASVDDLVKAYLPGTLGGFSYKGKLFAIPTEVSIHAPFINTKLFQDAGLDPVKDAPKYWEDLPPLAQKLNKDENGQLKIRAFDFIYGLPDDASGPINTLAGMAFQLGGTILNDDQTQAMVNTDPWIRTYQFVQDWVYKYKNGGPQYQSYYLAFIGETLAMGMSGSWFSADLKAQNSAAADHHTVIQMPRWKDAKNDTGALLFGYGLFTNSKSSSEVQKACQALIKELSSHPEDYLQNAGLLQPTVALSQTDVFKNTPHLDVFLKDMNGTPFMPVHPKYSEIMDALTRALQKVTTEQAADVKQTLDAAKAEIDGILAAR